MELKCIGKFSVKTKTITNEPCKTIWWVYSNGIVDINQRILSDKQEIPQYEVLCRKFGKTLFVKSFGFKWPTLNDIHQVTLQTLNDNLVNPDDLLY